ncbi:GNAT family N-acetyltransferase [Leptolyngbya ohadii]|uniref:GNAT family N-acetyltransferase n=1 Tax=Leptolyngbya ohadii TaxID=1962290 RepID=UPI000B5A106C|nr:GNAT family N-acetyltransferase [Leptolyngbya ohadii]
MVDNSPELPEGFRIRRLQLNDRDRLALYVMPNDPQKVLPFLSKNLKLAYHKFRLDFILINFVLMILFFVILPSFGNVSSNYWLWMGIIFLLFFGGWIAATFIPKNWHQFCWVAEYRGRFVAYGVLRPYRNYSELKWLYVYPNWRRRGIGSALVRTLIRYSTTPIYIKSVPNLIVFYTRLGFQTVHSQELPSDVQQHFRLRGAATLLIHRGIHNG